MKKKLSHEERYKICKKCPNLDKTWKVCKVCNCFMPLKTKIRWAECPEEPPRWTQGDENGVNCKAEEVTKGVTKSYSCQTKRYGQEKEEKTFNPDSEVTQPRWFTDDMAGNNED